MEEYSFEYYSQGDEFSLFDTAVPALPVDQHHESAFMNYSSQTIQGFRSKSWGDMGLKNDQNVNRRMIEFLKRSWKPTMIGPVEAERDRNHKHMINERMRRVRQKESFVQLHKILPLGTKGDKNSIVQMAAERVRELQTYEEDLKRRNIELELAIAAANHDDNDDGHFEEAKIKLKVAHPASGIDSMLEVLKCMKATGTKIKAFQSNFSSQEFSAILQIEAKIGAAEVEKAVQKTLFEVESKFRRSFSS